jgi:hypothetical protein
MLIYHQAFDPYHCAFRVVKLLQLLPMKDYFEEKIRILDFYLLFPSELNKARLPKGTSKMRKNINDLYNCYDTLQSPYRIFVNIEPVQQTALRYLASRGIISVEALGHGYVRRTDVEIPPSLMDEITKETDRSSAVLSFITSSLADIDLYGPNGLKARTRFYEYRYDITQTIDKTK